MRMAELSRASGVAVATIKYYQREGLVPPARMSASNQADYEDRHVERLRLVRALIEVGGLTVADAKRVIGAIDSDVDIRYVFEAAQHVASTPVAVGEVEPAALARVDELIAGWHVTPDNPGRLAAARAIQAFEGVGQSSMRGWYEHVADAALAVARADIDEITLREGRLAQAEAVVIGTVIGDALFFGLRRAAQEHVTAVVFGGGE